MSEPSVTERTAYFHLGLDIVKNNPFGVGIGNQVSYAVTNGLYQKFGLVKPILVQPIHNFYLLLLSEIGIPGLLAFLWFLVLLFKPLFQLKFKLHESSEKNLSLITSFLLLTTLLLFGLFDHFLWTLPQGQLMLWLVIGMVMAQFRARSSTDRIYPSEG